MEQAVGSRTRSPVPQEHSRIPLAMGCVTSAQMDSTVSKAAFSQAVRAAGDTIVLLAAPAQMRCTALRALSGTQQVRPEQRIAFHALQVVTAQKLPVSRFCVRLATTALQGHPYPCLVPRGASATALGSAVSQSAAYACPAFTVTRQACRALEGCVTLAFSVSKAQPLHNQAWWSLRTGTRAHWCWAWVATVASVLRARTVPREHGLLSLVPRHLPAKRRTGFRR